MTIVHISLLNVINYCQNQRKQYALQLESNISLHIGIGSRVITSLVGYVHAVWAWACACTCMLHYVRQIVRLSGLARPVLQHACLLGTKPIPGALVVEQLRVAQQAELLM